MFPLKSLLFGLLASCWSICLYAQKPTKKNTSIHTSKSTLIYDNVNYLNSIRSVKLSLMHDDRAFPIISLNGNERLEISFDDLRGEFRSLYYSVEHCNADWSPSRLASMDYLSGPDEDNISEFLSSVNPLTDYTHYKFIFPSESLRPKIAGNYLLKVYEDGDKERLLFTRKIFVLNTYANLDLEIIPSLESSKKHSYQKINLTLHSLLQVSNPRNNIQIQAYQNQRFDNTQIIKEASQISGNIISYKLPHTLDFKGNNEFRTIDLRSVRNTSTGISSIKRDTSISAYLLADEKTSSPTYLSKLDENGHFFIRNLDHVNKDIESEYIYTYFSLKYSENIKADIYLVGEFNNYQITPQNKLKYNAQGKVWETVQLLKQGIYNYEYILMEENKIITDAFSGSYYDTENEYQILVYYRKPGSYWDEIIGYKSVHKK